MSSTTGTYHTMRHESFYSVQQEATQLRNQCARTACRLRSRKGLISPRFRMFLPARDG
jgi:hypothetical protein